MERSSFDPGQIHKITFDEASRSVRTKLVDTEMSIELNHQDGDSVNSHPAKLIASAMGCDETDHYKEVIPPLDCSSLREVRVDVEGSGMIDVMISPTDTGNFFYKVGTEGFIIPICGRRIKVMAQKIMGNVHLVGRS